MAINRGDYLSRFRFTEAPFRLLPDPAFFFPAPPHISAREVLRYGIERGEGFMVLTGQAGTGKTLVLRLLLTEIGPDTLPVVVLTPALDPAGLVRLLLEDMGESTMECQDLGALLRRFQDRLLALASQGKTLLVVIDEAQNLPRETIEELMLLSNFETGTRKLLQILLVGQPELDGLLKDPGLRQLTQRITIRETLRSLTRKETMEYLAFRLARAGRPDLRPSWYFARRLHQATSGIPRLINRLMDRALLMAAASGSQNVGIRDLRNALATLPAPRPKRQFKHVLAAGVLLGIVACLCLFLVYKSHFSILSITGKTDKVDHGPPHHAETPVGVKEIPKIADSEGHD